MDRRRFFKLFAGLSATVVPDFGLALARRSRVAIAGGGIMGSSIAYHLAKRGAEVVLLEKEGPAAGATGKSFAWINAGYNKQPRHYNDLNRLSMLGYRHLEKELKGALKVQWGGNIRWSGDPELSRALRDSVHSHQQWGYAIRMLEEKEFHELEPNVQPGPVLAASFSELEGSIDPEQANRVLLEKAREAGARVEYPCEVTDLDMRWGRLRGIKTTCGEFGADVLVVTSGVDTPRLAEKAGIKVPLVDAPGILAHTKPISSRLIRRVVRGPDAEMKQKLDGRIVTGSGRRLRVRQATREDGERALAKAAAFLPQLKGAELERVTLGWRPLPQDGHPIVGFSGCCPDVYVAVMHSGVTLSPIMGRLAALEILDDVRVELLDHYRVSRFS